MSSALFDSVARIARHEAGARFVAAVGRVTDIFPAESGVPDHAVTVELRDSGLVLPRIPIAVGVLGFAAIPAVGELVLVVFEQGDVHAPVVVGRLYHPDGQPPKHKEGQIVLRLPAGSSSPTLELEIDGAAPSIDLKLPGDVKVRLEEQKVSLAAGELKVVLDGAGGGSAQVKAGGASLELKQDGDIKLKTSGNLNLEATQISIKGSGPVTVKGATVEIN